MDAINVVFARHYQARLQRLDIDYTAKHISSRWPLIIISILEVAWTILTRWRSLILFNRMLMRTWCSALLLTTDGYLSSSWFARTSAKRQINLQSCIMHLPLPWAHRRWPTNRMQRGSNWMKRKKVPDRQVCLHAFPDVATACGRLPVDQRSKDWSPEALYNNYFLCTG